MTECIDRQSLYVSDNMDLVCNLESRTLNRFLPGIPIFGFWSAGEIGFTTHDGKPLIDTMFGQRVWNFFDPPTGRSGKYMTALKRGVRNLKSMR